MNKLKIGIISGLIILAFGAGLLVYIVRSQVISASPSGIAQYHQKTDYVAPEVNVITGMPDELLIPSLNMDLTIVPGYYNARTGTWTLTLSEVQYATITPEPNNRSGNTFLYGHYRQAVFARLHTIPAGAQAIVKTTNGHSFYYLLSNIRTTTPNDDGAFQYQGPPILTIQTCTGILFQYRQLYTFTLLKAV